MMTDWQLGQQAFKEGRLREAVDRLQRAADDTERTVTQAARFETLAFLGAALYALGRASEAVAAFEGALRLAPTPPPAAVRFNLANAYLADGRPADAERELEQTLREAPGHVEARMLLQRLRRRPQQEPLKGAIFGSSPDAVLSYLRSVNFGSVASGGYDPAQVRQALSEVERYVQALAARLAEQEHRLASQELELERYRDMEDSLIENMMQTARAAAPAPPDAPHAAESEALSVAEPAARDSDDGLSPIERLFRQKPSPGSK